MTSSSPLPSSSAGVPPNLRLNGWKEIAAHFGRGIRTVQRWEKSLGMPVYRIGSGRGENVHAFSQELETWLAGVRHTADLQEKPGERGDGNGDGNGNGNGRGDDHGSDRERPADDLESDLETSSPSGLTPGQHRRRHLRLAAVLTFVVIGLVVAAGLFVAHRAGEAPSTPGSVAPGTPKVLPSDAKVDGDILRILDANGNELWEKRLDAPLTAGCEKDVAGSGKCVDIWDIDGDGSREVLVFAPQGNSRWWTALYCYDSAGRERWHKTFDGSVKFGAVSYTPPWSGLRLYLTGTGSSKALWVTWINVLGGQFPCVLRRLDPRTGEPVPGFEYWSAGYISWVTEADLAGRRSLLVGAANNDRRGASLAVFDADRVVGSAPAIDPDKRCGDCQEGGPRAFLVFPHMELAGLEGTGSVSEVRVSALGEVSVWVFHGRGVGDIAWLTYFLDDHLRPIRAEIGSGYREIHAAREAARLITHPFGARDLKEVWPVLVSEHGQFTPVVGTTR